MYRERLFSSFYYYTKVLPKLSWFSINNSQMYGQRMANTLHLHIIDYRVFSHSGEKERNYHPYFIDEETHIQRGYMTSSS